MNRSSSMTMILVCEMNLLTLWPWPLNPKTVPLLEYTKVIPYTKFEHFGIIRFRVMLPTNKQTNRQTDRQTDSKIVATPTDIVGVGKYRTSLPDTHCWQRANGNTVWRVAEVTAHIDAGVEAGRSREEHAKHREEGFASSVVSMCIVGQNSITIAKETICYKDNQE